jgi:hypothetical protein
VRCSWGFGMATTEGDSDNERAPSPTRVALVLSCCEEDVPDQFAHLAERFLPRSLSPAPTHDRKPVARLRRLPSRTYFVLYRSRLDHRLQLVEGHILQSTCRCHPHRHRPHHWVRLRLHAGSARSSPTVNLTSSPETIFTNQTCRAISVAARGGDAGCPAGVPVHEYVPTAVKSAVTGDGSATKDQVQQMVARLLRLDKAPQPADASDALAIALCHLRAAPLQVGR